MRWWAEKRSNLWTAVVIKPWPAYKTITVPTEDAFKSKRETIPACLLQPHHHRQSNSPRSLLQSPSSGIRGHQRGQEAECYCAHHLDPSLDLYVKYTFSALLKWQLNHLQLHETDQINEKWSVGSVYKLPASENVPMFFRQHSFWCFGPLLTVWNHWTEISHMMLRMTFPSPSNLYNISGNVTNL